MMLLGVLALLAGAALALDWLLRPDRFVIRHIHFEGPFQHVSREQLVQSVKDRAHGNFFAIDLDAVKAGVESLPWVYRASVRRQWPGALYIRFSEQRLVARWGAHDWINEAGELVRNIRADDAGPDVAQLAGPDGTHRQVLAGYRRFAALLAPLGQRPVELALGSRRTWRLRLDGDVLLLLGREHAEARLARFVQAYNHGLAQREDRIARVDLRYTNGFSVQWNDTSAQAARVELAHKQ